MSTNVYKDCNMNPERDWELKCELVRVVWPGSAAQTSIGRSPLRGIYGSPALIRQS